MEVGAYPLLISIPWEEMKMGSQAKFTIRIYDYLRGPKVPQSFSSYFSKPKMSALKAPMPASIPGLRVARADYSFSPKIEQISVEQKIADLNAALKLEADLRQERIQAEPKKRSFLGKIAAASLAALSVTLIPKLAFAGTLGGALAALASSPLGIAALVGGGALLLTFYVKYMFGFDKTMSERNNNPGDKTLLKQLAIFSAIPAAIAAGSGLLYLGACMLPWGAAPTFFALAGAGLVYGLYKTGKSIYQSIKANEQTITPGYKSRLRAIFGTNILSHGVQGAEAAYMFYRGATLFELLAGVSSYAINSIVAGGAAGLAVFGTGALGLGGLIFLGTAFYLRFTSKKCNQMQHDQGRRFDLRSKRGIRTVLLAAAGSALAGGLLWSGAPIVINIALALAFFATEVHALVHNWSCQGGSREIIQTPPEEYSNKDVWNAARRPNSPWITVMKPGFEPREFIVPTYSILYLRKGVNWDFNIICGANMGLTFAFKENHEALEFLRNKQKAILDIVSRGRSRIGQASNPSARYQELAKLYEELAEHWSKESVGDFSNLTVTKEYRGKTNVFSSPEADEVETYLGETIKYEGEKFIDLANKLRQRDPLTMSREEIEEHLESLERQFSVIFHWFPPKQFRNICPDVIRSKIREIDLFNQNSAKDFRSGASILRKNRFTGEYYWEILPTQRIWDLDTTTNKLNWRNRTRKEMSEVESYSDIRFVDNTNMTDPVGAQHERSAYTYGAMQPADSLEINFRDGSRLSFTRSGGPSVGNQLRNNPDRDPVVWVPGMDLDPKIEAALPKDWKESNGKIHDVFKPALFHFFGSKYQTMCDGEHADIITSDFLAPLEKDIKDPYIFTFWKVPEKVTVPNPENLKEEEGDHLVRISASYGNFCLRVKEKDSGKVLYIPYNWMKNQQIKGPVWTEAQRIELISRKEFEKRYNTDPRDGHGDKLPYVIVPYDGNNNRLILSVNEKGFKGIGPDPKQIWNDLISQGYLDGDGKIQLKFDAVRDNFILSINASKKEVDEIFKVLLEVYRTVLPYSYFLKEPSKYETAEFDRGLGRIGDMNFYAYTFLREDGTRYMRWLPKEDDWQEMDFDERHQRFEFKGKNVILHACRWIGKRFFFDKHRLVLNPGTKENPNFEVTGIEGPEAFLRSIGAKGKFVISRYIRNADGSLANIGYAPFTGSIQDLNHVVDQRINNDHLELTRITPDDKKVVALGNDAPLNHPSTWIESVSINNHQTDKKIKDPNIIRLTLTYTNPFSKASAGTQDIDLDRRLFPDMNSIYREGNNQAYLPKIFDQRQKDTGNIENKLFLTFYTQRVESVAHGISRAPNEELKLIEVKTSLRIKHLNGVNGETKGVEEVVPFDHEMPRASKSQIWFDPDHKPFSSGLEFGRVDTMIAPQHLVPVSRIRKPGPWRDLVKAPWFGEGAAGPEWATDDQKFYFGEIYDESGEYNWPHGWVKGEKRGRGWSKGPFSLQYAKSIRGAALNTGSNTVMRAPHEDLLFEREELEVYAEWNGRNYMPVPLKKSLFDKATTTEDAQGAWEKRRMLDLETRMDRTVRSIGSSVNNIGEGMGQRGRWAAMLQFLQRAGKIFKDEIVRARILKRIPPQYSNKQLHEWFNTFTWYLDTAFKHVVPLIPFAYMLGLSPLPAGAIVFPLLWFIKTAVGWPKYSYDNQRVGVSRIRSYFRNLALYYLYIPNISRNTVHINDEAKGPFISTAGIGGKTFFPWAVRRIVFYFGGLSGITAAVGLYRIISFGMLSMGYFGLIMNVFWPAVMFAGVSYAVKMAWNQMRNGRNVPGILSCLWQGVRRWNWTPMKDWLKLLNDEFIKPCTIEWFKELGKSFKNMIQYFKGAY